MRDATIARCRNDAGTTRDFATLTVRRSGSGSAGGIREQVHTIAEGDTVEINCDVSGEYYCWGRYCRGSTVMFLVSIIAGGDTVGINCDVSGEYYCWGRYCRDQL